MAEQILMNALLANSTAPGEEVSSNGTFIKDTGELDYAYSGLSCNMSSTCYGGVYQGEYTPTELMIIVFMLGLWIYSIMLTRKAYGILNADT